MVRILVVEDDATVRDAVAAYLARAGHDVETAPDGESAVAAFTARPADLVLLDLMLPGLGGLEVTRRLRSMRRDLPLIMVTARSQEHERVQGLQHGADDYVTKPFSLRELELRVRSVLRRATAPPPEVAGVLRDGDLVVDLGARTVTRGGEALSFTARELDLLAWFLQHPGVVWSRDELMREVWGWDVGDASTVTVHVRRVREKVEADPGAPVRLATVFGRGYRWDAAPDGAAAPVASDAAPTTVDADAPVDDAPTTVDADAPVDASLDADAAVDDAPPGPRS
ncbi:response regulator transcription factor [Phycicoccus flavus]|uniref:Response regulator transcription factor n=1 Tax=Phycicoccus flavus TaxID=2502783 RepID=A0A8T6QYD8_9MICO|nr:response regulator transcription factor [Phycicoccus flavus]NHA66527.1 response regulator transcription factor [Phycicoccus flavus]